VSTRVAFFLRGRPVGATGGGLGGGLGGGPRLEVPTPTKSLSFFLRPPPLFFGGMLQSPANTNEESGLLVRNIVKR
jgi:hypothetical protein